MSEAVFPKKEINSEWNISFLQNNPLAIQYTYSSEFSNGLSISETSTLVWFEVAPSYYI